MAVYCPARWTSREQEDPTMTTKTLLVIGSVPSKLYGIVRFELFKRGVKDIRVLRLDLEKFVSKVDHSIFDESCYFHPTLTVEAVQAQYPDFNSEAVVAIAAARHQFLSHFVDTFFDAAGTYHLPYYELSEFESGEQVLFGSGFFTHSSWGGGSKELSTLTSSSRTKV